MSKLVRQWHFNRPQSLRIKLIRWAHNPIGALIRLIEFSAFGVPLVSLLKSSDHFREISHLNPEVTHSDEYFMFKENRFHLDNCLVLLKSGHIFFTKLSYQSFLSGLHSSEIRELQNARKVLKFEKVIILPKQEYYYHFVVEYLPSILSTLSKSNGFTVLSLENQPKFVWDYFKILGIEFTTSDTPIVQITDAILPTNLEGENYAILLESLDKLLPAKVVKPRKKILLLRRGMPRDDESLNYLLTASLISLGFEEIDLAAYSIDAQITLFREADFIVALHGGALTNIIYSPQGTRVVEIFSDLYRNYDYERIAIEKGLLYSAIDSRETSKFIESMTLNQ